MTTIGRHPARGRATDCGAAALGRVMPTTASAVRRSGTPSGTGDRAERRVCGAEAEAAFRLPEHARRSSWGWHSRTVCRWALGVVQRLQAGGRRPDGSDVCATRRSRDAGRIAAIADGEAHAEPAGRERTPPTTPPRPTRRARRRAKIAPAARCRNREAPRRLAMGAIGSDRPRCAMPCRARAGRRVTTQDVVAAPLRCGRFVHARQTRNVGKGTLDRRRSPPCFRRRGARCGASTQSRAPWSRVGTARFTRSAGKSAGLLIDSRWKCATA